MNYSQIKQIILNYKYSKLSNIILNLEIHIDNLFKNYKLSYSNKNNYLKDIFNISKELNTSYNKYIVNNENIHASILKLYNIFPTNIDKNIIIDIIKPLLKRNNSNLPLYTLELDLLNIIYDVGYTSIIEIIKVHDILLNNNQNIFINEINKLFVPTKVRKFNVANRNDDYYWTIPNSINESDLLELNRELWIKNIDTENEYIKIEGYFINDTLSILMKTCQLEHSILYNKKNEIIKSLNNTCNLKFMKKCIRYDYLGNIYTMSKNDYINRLNTLHTNTVKLIDTTFINIMKNFIGDEFKLKTINEIIFLLLLGTDENVTMVNLLLDLTKERKMNTPNIYQIIIQNIPYYLQVRIKKTHNIMKDELKRMKTITLEDINYKTLLINNKHIPDHVKLITSEKIEEMKTFNNEYHKQLTFVKHIINYPWSKSDIVNIDNPSKYIDNIENNLKKATYGHNDAKNALLELIGKWVKNPASNGTCFGLVGPPGVGKTLLAKSISSALDVPFAEITLGGQNDGEILHGHGYTYAGSQPGMIVKKMVEMGKSRCILYFDELDKACSKHGATNEITSILIHLTDPNMNTSFQDRFFQGIDFPLDKVIMIFSYNDSKLVDPILLDRLQQIQVDAYTISDKVNIISNFIIPEIAKSIGLEKETWINIDESILEYMIESYTNEAGVRAIKRLIEKIFLSLNLDKIYKRNNFSDNTEFKITKEMVNKILDKVHNEILLIHKEPTIGIINGLYATNNGNGGIIPIQVFINAYSSNNLFEMKYTGKQGDVMKESVQCSFTAAIEYIKRSTNHEFNINEFKYGFHIHTPSTSTPKDGPSAGIAFTCAFISRILNRPIRNDIAMTGEIELTGKITKIGGLNYKLFGAKKAGVKICYVPKENENDINEIKVKYPKLIDVNFNVILFDYIDDYINDILLS